jgi:hypothetical protein
MRQQSLRGVAGLSANERKAADHAAPRVGDLDEPDGVGRPTAERGTMPMPTPAATMRQTALKLRTWMRTSSRPPSCAAWFIMKV